MMTNDTLKTMFEMQYALQKKLGNIDMINESSEMRQQYINQMLLACYEEVTEIMKETAYKNPDYVPFGWKKGQKNNFENMKEEIIDLWHFIMNLSIAAFMDADEFFEIYCKKNDVNIERQKNNY